MKLRDVLLFTILIQAAGILANIRRSNWALLVYGLIVARGVAMCFWEAFKALMCEVNAEINDARD